MYERIRAMYADGRLDAVGVGKAVQRGWITQEQADAITSAV